MNKRNFRRPAWLPLLTLALAVGLAGCPATEQQLTSDRVATGPTTAPTSAPTTAPTTPSSGELAKFEHLAALTEGLRSPARIALAPDGTVLVTDPHYGHIARFTVPGETLPAWPVAGRPLGIAVQPDGAHVILSLRGQAQPATYRYDAASDALELTDQQLGNGAVAFVQPTDIEIAPGTGDIYVLDGLADRVFRFSSAGELLTEIGQRGTSAGQFKYPSALAIDAPRQLLIVADQDNWRVQLLDLSGRFLGQFGERIKSIGDETEAWLPRSLGLAVDAAGNIYVADALMSAVRVFDAAGKDLGKFVDFGSGPEGVCTPSDLAVSADGTRLYVVSTGTSSVQVYAIPSQLTESHGTHTWNAAAAGPIKRPLPGCTAAWQGHQIDGETVCKRCHGLTGQPGENLGTVEGQACLCLSCHTAVGHAFAAPLHPLDIADPYSTNPAAPNARGVSHAWGVPAINAAAGSVGPNVGGALEPYLSNGLIKCATCHNQHNSDAGAPYLRVSNAIDALCRECHSPFDAAEGQPGLHPVSVTYPGPSGEFPDTSDLIVTIKCGRIGCTSCHAVHGTHSDDASGGTGDGRLLRAADVATLCTTCHTQHANHLVRGGWQPTCTDCHKVHGPDNPNLALVAQQIHGAAETFIDDSNREDHHDDFVHVDAAPPAYDGLCQVCHTATLHFRNTPGSEDIHFRNLKMVCTDCHQHRYGFLPYCAGCHEDGFGQFSH